MDLEALVNDLRSYPGILRKKTISDVLSFFPKTSQNRVLAAYGEDAAVIEHKGSVLLLAADGIMESLMKANPWFAGYYAILVNINDIAAMGGIPLALVDIISMKDEKVCSQVMKGMESASTKFGVPVVGGHTHPDCNYNAVDVAILGTAEKEEVIYSHKAQIGDDIIFVMDLDGYYPEKLNYAWDTTSRKDAEKVRRQILLMNEVGKKRLAHSGKDMSNPGSIGTLGMLLETSGKGGVVDLDKIPRPKGIDFNQWLKSYQGCGFVLTADPRNSMEIISIFQKEGVDGAIVGRVDNSSKLIIQSEGESKILFDFRTDKITGCGPELLPERCKYTDHKC
ncbi:MAG: methanogenesis marker 2 protein [Methanomassiliicoccales archaeon]